MRSLGESIFSIFSSFSGITAPPARGTRKTKKKLNMDLRKYNKGTVGNKGGRPTKNDEIKLIEELTPLEPIAYKSLKAGLERGEFK